MNTSGTRIKRRLRLLPFLVMALVTLHVFGQQTKEELAQEAANPLADLMSFPFQNNLNMNYGPFDRNLNVLNIQPVIPFSDSEHSGLWQ